MVDVSAQENGIGFRWLSGPRILWHGMLPRNVVSRKGGTGVNTHRHRTSLVQFQRVAGNVFVQPSQRSLIARFQSIVTGPGCCVIGLAPLGDPLGEGFLLLLIGFNFFLGPAMGFGEKLLVFRL